MSVYWRFKNEGKAWYYGFMTDAGAEGLVRMGRWNGDTSGGTVVARDEIEVKEYTK